MMRLYRVTPINILYPSEYIIIIETFDINIDDINHTYISFDNTWHSLFRHGNIFNDSPNVD